MQYSLSLAGLNSFFEIVEKAGEQAEQAEEQVKEVVVEETDIAKKQKEQEVVETQERVVMVEMENTNNVCTEHEYVQFDNMVSLDSNLQAQVDDSRKKKP